jgi:hypothetical protein
MRPPLPATAASFLERPVAGQLLRPKTRRRDDNYVIGTAGLFAVASGGSHAG